MSIFVYLLLYNSFVCSLYVNYYYVFAVSKYLSSKCTTIFPDVDECLNDNGACEQICVNSEGSFSCACKEGFRLAQDRRRCLRMFFLFHWCNSGV